MIKQELTDEQQHIKHIYWKVNLGSRWVTVNVQIVNMQTPELKIFPSVNINIYFSFQYNWLSAFSLETSGSFDQMIMKLPSHLFFFLSLLLKVNMALSVRSATSFFFLAYSSKRQDTKTIGYLLKQKLFLRNMFVYLQTQKITLCPVIFSYLES